MDPVQQDREHQKHVHDRSRHRRGHRHSQTPEGVPQLPRPEPQGHENRQGGGGREDHRTEHRGHDPLQSPACSEILLDEQHPRVHGQPDPHGDARQAHDVELAPREAHRRGGRQNREGNPGAHHQGGGEAALAHGDQQHHQDDARHDRSGQFPQRLFDPPPLVEEHLPPRELRGQAPQAPAQGNGVRIPRGLNVDQEPRSAVHPGDALRWGPHERDLRHLLEPQPGSQVQGSQLVQGAEAGVEHPRSLALDPEAADHVGLADAAHQAVDLKARGGELAGVEADQHVVTRPSSDPDLSGTLHGAVGPSQAVLVRLRGRDPVGGRRKAG